MTTRTSVDLPAWPGLVVVYLGLRVPRRRGIATLPGVGRGIGRSVARRPPGLLAHEGLVFGLTHIGMRQYWQDLEPLEAFTRSEPHKTWWRDFLRDNGGSGLWHESYRMAGGMEAISLDMPWPTGFASFAPSRAAEGARFSARGRLLPEGDGAGVPASE
jgi:hypothetical protein